MRSSHNYLPRARPATIAIISFAYFVIAVVVLHFLNPAYDLIKSFEGNYDLGSYQFLIASTFFALGLGSLALVIGLYQKMSRSAGLLIGLLSLGIWGLGIISAGIFPANEGGSTVPHMTTVLLAGIFPVNVMAYPETSFSFIHILAILWSLLSLTFATFSLSWRFKQEEKWRFIHPLSSFIALVMIAASIFLFQAMFLRFYTEVAGLSLKLLTFGGLLWLFLTANRLLFIVEESSSN